MNIGEIVGLIKDQIPNLIFESSYSSGNSDYPIKAGKLVKLRNAIDSISNIPFIVNEIKALKESSLFKTFKDEDMFNATQDALIKKNVGYLFHGLSMLLNYYNQNDKPQNGISIKLPELNSFDELSKISTDLKKAFEIPIIDQQKEGHVQIKAIESGSIWVVISVGSVAAVNLVAAICWASAVIRKKKAEAKIFEAHANTLNLKNDALKSLIEAQEQQLKNIIQSESELIADKNFDIKDPEVINRLKLSIVTVSDLIDRGAKILPTSDSKETMKQFPDYTKLDLIESSIKQIAK